MARRGRGPVQQGLPRSRRIRKRPDFVRIQTGGLRVTTRHFVLLFSAGTNFDGAPRLGIVASRKVGGAVERNRAKRLVREAFRTSSGLFPPGIDAVVVIRAGAHALGLASVVAELDAVRPLVRRVAAKAIAQAIAGRREPTS